jgi:hypothetical protein
MPEILLIPESRSDIISFWIIQPAVCHKLQGKYKFMLQGFRFGLLFLIFHISLRFSQYRL